MLPPGWLAGGETWAAAFLEFYGSGTMATAMIAGLIKQKLIDPKKVTTSDPYPGQLEKLAGRYKVNTTSNNLETIKDKDIIILSIKPQSLDEVAAEYSRHALLAGP